MSARHIRPRADRSEESADMRGITRRAFLAAGGATALSFFLPSLGRVGDGFAYAVETGAVDASGQPEFDIYVITREEIGLSVVDVTGNAKTPVAGASVTLTSTKTKASVTVTADENGLAVFNLKTSKLGEPMQLEGVGNGYRFEGSIKTVVPGQGDTWMDFETGRLRADGGTAIQTPLRQKANVTDPYFTMLSFDGWDILYTDNGVVSTPANTDDHTFAGKLYVPSGAETKVELIARASGKDDVTVFAKTVTPQNNVAEFSQTARYLFIYKDNKNLLPDGCDYLYRVTVGGVTYTMTTKFTVRQAPVSEPTYLTSSMSADEKSLGSFSLPSDIPAPLGGSNLSIWCPTFPFMGWMSPQGYGFFAATLSSEFKNTAPCTNKSAWTDETCMSAKGQFEYLTSVWGASLDKLGSTSNLLDPKASVKDKFAMSSVMTIDVTAQAYLLAEWDYAAKLWRATLNGLVVANLGFTFTARTTVGPVPLFLTFKLSLGGKVSASIGVETIDFKTIDIPKTSGLGYTTTISIALTLGAGVPGVASAGLRGSGYLVFYVSFLDTSGKVPHMVAGFGLAADVVVQMLLFTWTGKLWSYKKDPFYDNAKANLLQDARPDLSLNPTAFALGTDSTGAPLYSHTAPFDPTKGLNLDEFIKQSSIVTESTLSKTRELKGARTANIAALSAEDAPPVTLLDNGIAIIDLSGTGSAAGEGIAAAAAESASEFAYEYVGEDLDEVCSAVGGVAGIAPAGGVTPTVDKKIATRIFGSPNCKVVVFLDQTYLFRLLSVDYDNGGATSTRTRLAVQRMNANGKWSTPQVLEFSRFDASGTSRIDTFDYDFDVYANESATSGYVESGLCIILLSGTRPRGDSTDFFSASNSTIMSIGVFDSGLRCTMSYTWKDVPGAAAAPYQALMLPRVAPVNTGDEDAGTMGIALLYMRRTADSPEQVLGNGARVTAEFGHLVASQLYLGGREEIDPSTYDLKIFDNSARGAQAASFSFAVQSDKGMSITSVFPKRTGKTLTAATAHLLADASTASQSEFTVKHNIVNATGLENSQPWPHRPAILVPEDGILTALTFDPEAEGGSFTKTKVGPENAKISTFVVSPSGNAIYYMVNQEGDGGQAYDENGNPTSAEKVERHTIYACSLVDGLFTKPFPLANTSHAIDALENAYAGSTYTFLATCITNMANNSADIYYINVPAAATASPIGLAAENAFVCAGATGEPFLLELRNDGNVILKGCTIELRDADVPEPNNVVSTVEGFLFNAENLTGSIWNPELLASVPSEVEPLRADEPEPVYATESLEALGIGEDHVLVSPRAAGVLLPGDSGQFRVRFDIPASWKSGHKNVYITCGDFMYDMVALGPGESIVEHPTTLPVDDAHKVTISVPNAEEGNALGDALLAPEGSTPGGGDQDGPGGGDPDGPGGGDPSAGGDGGKDPDAEGAHGSEGQKDEGENPTIPQTGDPARLTLAGLAVAAAAAGITAYSARRHMIEQEEREADEE